MSKRLTDQLNKISDACWNRVFLQEKDSSRNNHIFPIATDLQTKLIIE